MAVGATMNSIRFDNPVAETPGDTGDTFDIEADEKGVTFDVDDYAVDPKEYTAAADPAASRSSSRRLSLTNEFLYQHITPLEVQVITLLSTPGSAFLLSVVLHRGVPLVEKFSYFIVTALSIALVLHHHNETVNTTDEGTGSTAAGSAGSAEVDWNLGVGLAFASTVCTSFLILHQEIGATADRQGQRAHRTRPQSSSS